MSAARSRPWQAKRVKSYIEDKLDSTIRAGDLAALVRLRIVGTNPGGVNSICVLVFEASSPDELRKAALTLSDRSNNQVI